MLPHVSQSGEASQEFAGFLIWKKFQIRCSSEAASVQDYVCFSLAFILLKVLYRTCVVYADHLERRIPFGPISWEVSGWWVCYCDSSESLAGMAIFSHSFDDASQSWGPVFFSKFYHCHPHSPMTAEFVGMFYDLYGLYDVEFDLPRYY